MTLNFQFSQTAVALHVQNEQPTTNRPTKLLGFLGFVLQHTSCCLRVNVTSQRRLRRRRHPSLCWITRTKKKHQKLCINASDLVKTENGASNGLELMTDGWGKVVLVYGFVVVMVQGHHTWLTEASSSSSQSSSSFRCHALVLYVGLFFLLFRYFFVGFLSKFVLTWSCCLCLSLLASALIGYCQSVSK